MGAARSDPNRLIDRRLATRLCVPSGRKSGEGAGYATRSFKRENAGLSAASLNGSTPDFYVAANFPTMPMVQ